MTWKITLGQAQALFNLCEMERNSVEDVHFDVDTSGTEDARAEFMTGIYGQTGGARAIGVTRGTKVAYGTGDRVVVTRTISHTRGGRVFEYEYFFNEEEEREIGAVVKIVSAINTIQSELENWKNGWMEDDFENLHAVARKVAAQMRPGSDEYALFEFLSTATDQELRDDMCVKGDLENLTRDCGWGAISQAGREASVTVA